MSYQFNKEFERKIFDDVDIIIKNLEMEKGVYMEEPLITQFPKPKRKRKTHKSKTSMNSSVILTPQKTQDSSFSRSNSNPLKDELN